MNAVISQETIDVDRLCVGMFVQLDGGWMSHPFPLSNFRIASDEQIATIRSLGVRRVRWVRAQSDPVPEAAHGRAPATATAANDPGSPADADPGVAAPDSPGEKLRAQRASLQRCERQFAEAAQESRQVTESVVQRPRQACAHAEALIQALLGKMLGEQELCIRLLGDAAGDKASTHALNVTIISMVMGKTFGFSETEMMDLGMGALLHDIGKLELPARVRHREDGFSSAEARFYEDHVAKGVVLGRRMNLSPGAALVIAQHHEQADGSGFPMRLNADRMSISARIVALVNRYDNLCNPALPSRAMTPHESLSLLFAQGKAKFETAILGAFIKMMGVYPAGSTVQLTDDRYAMVIGTNSSRPLKPRVLVHDARVAADDALYLDLETAPGLGIRRSIRPQHLPAPALAYLAPRQRVAYFFEPLAEAPLAA